MSTAVRWGVAIVVIAGLAWLVWWSGWLTSKGMSPVTTNSGQATTTPQQEQPQNGMSASNDASNEAVAQDAAAIDAQMQAYAADSAGVDSSLNDKAVTQ
jgi:hypothetical protein